MNEFEFHLCDLFENNPFDDRNVSKQIKENNILITSILKNSPASDLETETINNIQPKVKEVVKSKKNDGPFECTLCDRKFIYESGLTSHLAKHALEVPVDPKQLLKDVIKCLICSIVLDSEIGVAMDHFIKNHYSVEPNSQNGGQSVVR